VFINLRTSDPARLQCVLNAELNQPLSDETLVELEGKLSEIPAKAHANFNVEFKIDNMNILQKPCSSSNVSEIKSKIKRSRANPKIYTILALRNIITQKLNKIFSEDLQFIQIPPKILTNYVFEGSTNSAFVASTPKQPNNSKFLTQSNQLYLQSALPALGNVYSISSCFRNEAIPSNRHLKEFVQLEAEYFCRDFDFLIEIFQYVLIKLSESLLKTEYSAKLDSAIIENVLKSSHNLLNLKTITYSHAIDILKSNGQLENKTEDDVKLTESQEKAIVEILGGPILVTHYPTFMKPFYAKQTEKSSDHTYSFDLLVPKIGEIASGTVREENFETVSQRLEKIANRKDFEWFLESLNLGIGPHGGFGIGLERLNMFLSGTDNIFDVLPHFD